MNDILFGNNNKAVIKKLANRSFRSNKMRNVIAVIAIALTTFLFTAVLTIGMGAKGTLEYNMAKMIGTGADALVQGLSEEQFQQLKENSMFEKVGCWVPIEIMTNTNRIFAEIDYADQPQLELRMQTPRTGSAPQKANEVLVSANILKDLNIEEKIGAEIPVELKVRQSGQMYHFDMIVSGIYDTPNEKSESVIVSKAFMEENPEMMREIAQGREGCGIYDVFNVTMNNIVSSEGAAKTTMCALLLGAVLNIGLDPLFIYTFNMGVAGAAIATAISQLVSTLVYLTYILRKRSAFSFSLKAFSPNGQMMAEILKIGVPTLVFQLLTSLSIALINRAASDYGDSVIAGMGAVTRITSMGTLVVFGFVLCK